MAAPVLGGDVPRPKIEITSAVVTVTVNAGGKGIRLDVVGDLSNVVWKVEGCDQEFRISPNNYLQLNFDIVEDSKSSRMSNLREGLGEFLVTKSKRAVGRKKKK